MAIDAAKALQVETDFLTGVEANFEAAKGTIFRGSSWRRSRADEGDRLRALMAEHHNYDREKLKTLPANRRVALHGFERRMLWGKRRTGVAIASVLSPLGHYASSAKGEAPPIGLGELAEHLRKLVGDTPVLHIIGVCSPTGFTEEARSATLSHKNVIVVLSEPDGQGGWRTTASGDSVEPALLHVFDPESAKQKLSRVRRVIEEHGAELLTGGLSASALAKKANLPEDVVGRGFELIAAEDRELQLTKSDGDFVLFRGAAPKRQENQSMNVIDRIKQLLSGDAGEAEKINLLAERRATLTQRRDRLYEAIGQLEKRESQLLEQGKAAQSSVPKRRIAAQVAQLRKDVARQNTTAAMLNQQINIISTDIHNLTLIQQGQRGQLPNTEELTDHAVAAEEMLETLKADADLVSSLETGIEETMTGEEELAILRELEGEPDKPAVVESALPPVTPPEVAAPERPVAEDPSSAAPRAEPTRPPQPSDPEAT